MKLLILGFSILLSTTLQAQSWQWGIRGGGTVNNLNNFQETVIDMATDNVGNVYIISSVNSDGFPTITGAGQAVTRYGGMDNLLTSYTCGGSLRWTKTIGGGLDDVANAIAADTLGHVYITGMTGNPNAPQTQVHFDDDTTIPCSKTTAGCSAAGKLNRK